MNSTGKKFNYKCSQQQNSVTRVKTSPIKLSNKENSSTNNQKDVTNARKQHVKKENNHCFRKIYFTKPSKGLDKHPLLATAEPDDSLEESFRKRCFADFDWETPHSQSLFLYLLSVSSHRRSSLTL